MGKLKNTIKNSEQNCTLFTVILMYIDCQVIRQSIMYLFPVTGVVLCLRVFGVPARGDEEMVGDLESRQPGGEFENSKIWVCKLKVRR